MFIIELAVANISIDNKMRKIKIVVVALELKIKMVIFTIYYVCQSNRNMFYKATSRNQIDSSSSVFVIEYTIDL